MVADMVADMEVDMMAALVVTKVFLSQTCWGVGGVRIVVWGVSFLPRTGQHPTIPTRPVMV